MTAPAPGRLHVSPTVVWTEQDGVVYVANAASTAPFVVVALEGTAATIWRLLQDAPAEDRLITRVAAEYDVEPSRVVPEVLRFLNDLHRGDLLTRGGERVS